MNKPKKGAAVTYSPPNGRKRRCAFVRSHVDTPSGIWWELKDTDGVTLRARPGSVKW